MLPNMKLVTTLIKLSRMHGQKIAHADDVDALTRDLGEALRRQKYIIQSQGALDIATDPVTFASVFIEIQLLRKAVASKLEIDTGGKPASAVLEEIVRKTEERNSTSAKEIKNTLDWTRAFFSHPEVQALLQMDMISIEKPSGLTDIRGMKDTVFQSGMRLSQEFNRVQRFLQKAGELSDLKAPAEPERKAPPKARKTPPKAAKSRKKSGPKAAE